MTFSIALTLLVVFGAIVLLMVTRAGADLVLLGGLTLLIIAGVVPVKAALTGFSNEGLIAVAVLFVVAEGLEQTGAVGAIVQTVLGRPRSGTEALVRLMFPTALMSAVLNNTPIVAIMMPVVDDWAKKYRLSVSQLMMPLSFATILGGLCTVLGTSTTVVVNGMMPDAGLEKLRLFDLAWVGVPCCAAGLSYILLTNRLLLPQRKSPISIVDDPREYTVEMVVQMSSPLVGRTIEEAGLRHLPGMYLLEVERENRILPAVSPKEILMAEDRLVFVGVVESVVDLQKLPGLAPATNQVFKLDSPRSERCLIEAVVSNTCPLINSSIREARFRTRYNAAVIAVARNGERLRGKIGDIVLLPGDTLLLEAHPSFAELMRNSRDFFLVSKVENSTPLRRDKAWLAQAILVSLILCITLAGSDFIVPAALLASSLMIVSGCVRSNEARSSIDWGVLITIAAGIGIGHAMEVSGAGEYVAHGLISLGQNEPHAVLAIVYGITMVFTNLITAKAAATLVFPIAVSTAHGMSVSPIPFVVGIMIASAASFATPIGYQTNLMVQGPGGYRYGDYTRFGGPLSLVLWLVSMLVIPRVWTF